MRTVIVKAKTVCTAYSKSEVTQGYLVALASPPPRTGSRFYPIGERIASEKIKANAIYLLTFWVIYDNITE